MMRDIGVECEIILHCDNQSAIDFSKRQGLGKAKHMMIGLLWLQDKVENKEVMIKKIHTDLNIADLMTKYLPPKKREFLMERMSMYYFQGHHDMALRAR